MPGLDCGYSQNIIITLIWFGYFRFGLVCFLQFYIVVLFARFSLFFLRGLSFFRRSFRGRFFDLAIVALVKGQQAHPSPVTMLLREVVIHFIALVLIPFE